MPIAILGWGSIIWDPRDLPHYGPWKRGGPKLPIEFSRVSNDCRLTLVIDIVAGAQCPTRFVLSPRSDVSDAAEDLRRREGTVQKHIGFYNKRTDQSSIEKYPQQVNIIDVLSQWCNEKRIDALVWTALPSNFKDETEVVFSVEAAITYLRGLPMSALENSLKYVRNAPEEVDTPLRRRISAEWPP